MNFSLRTDWMIEINFNKDFHAYNVHDNDNVYRFRHLKIVSTMKMSPLFCIPSIYGHAMVYTPRFKWNASPHFVSQINSSTASSLPLLNVTEGRYVFSLIQEGRKGRKYVHLHSKWDKIATRITWHLWATLGRAILFTLFKETVLTSIAAVASFVGLYAPVMTAGAVVAMGGIMVPPIVLFGMYFTKDSVQRNSKTQKWHIVSQTSNVPFTFMIEKSINKVGVLDASLFGLKHPLTTWALRARLVTEPDMVLQTGENIVVLQFIDLGANNSNRETSWLFVNEKGSIGLSEEEATVFIASPTST